MKRIIISLLINCLYSNEMMVVTNREDLTQVLSKRESQWIEAPLSDPFDSEIFEYKEMIWQAGFLIDHSEVHRDFFTKKLIVHIVPSEQSPHRH